MIKGFVFEDFKSFQKAELFLEDITTLIGTNASGKSNVIEGIEILSEIASGKDLATILDGSRNSDSFVRGGSKGCCRFKATSFGLGCLIDLDEKQDLLYKIKISVSERIYVEDESLTVVANGSMQRKGLKIFYTKPATDKKSANIQVVYRNGKKGNNPGTSLLRDMAILPQMKAMQSEDDPVLNENAKYIGMMLENLRKILILSPNPDFMGEYARISDSVLKHDCSNLSSVLFSICKNPDVKEQLLHVIRQLPENEIKNIGFLQPGNGDVLFYLEEKYKSSYGKIYANQLSAGTLRSLAAVAALLSESSFSLVIIDEVDNGIHPSRAKALLTWLGEIGKQRNVDLMVTTHNAILLNSLNEEDILGVSVAYREKESGASNIVAFVDLDNYPNLLAMGGIGTAAERDQLLSSLNQERRKKMPDWLGGC